MPDKRAHTPEKVQDMIAGLHAAADEDTARALAPGGILHPYAALIETDPAHGEEALIQASAWLARYGGHPEDILLRRMAVSRGPLLEALAIQTGLPAFSYTECLAVPPEPLHALSEKVFSEHVWFPVGLDGETVLVASCDPLSEDVRREAAECLPGRKLSWLVALRQDIRALCLDYVPRHSGK